MKEFETPELEISIIATENVTNGGTESGEDVNVPGGI